MRTILRVLSLLGIAISIFSCSENVQDEKLVSMKANQFLVDIDNNRYPLAELNAQLWTASNLKVTRFRNGDSIMHITGNYAWYKAGEQGIPAWRYVNDDPSTFEKYGLLYNGFAITDPRGIAPEGWRIPDSDDWFELIGFFGDDEEPWKRTASLQKENEEMKTFESGYVWDNLGSKLMGFHNPGLLEDVGEEGLFSQFAGEVDRYGNFYDSEKRGFWWIWPANLDLVVMDELRSFETATIMVTNNNEKVLIKPAYFRQRGYSVRLTKDLDEHINK